MTAEGFENLPGTPMRSGAITISPQEKLLLAEVLGSEPTEGTALHPLHPYIIAQRGIDESIADICAFADFSIDDGPMMGSLELDLTAETHAGVEYTVEGEIVDLIRKEGAKRGAFDLLTYRERVIDPSGRTVATATNTFVLFRKAEQA